MNFVFISPNYPMRYFKFVEALRSKGVNVLGISDGLYGDLHPRLVRSLTEYYFVKSLNDFEEVSRGISYYEQKYGKIDYIESNNEWWLNLDAALREKFGVTTGFMPEEMDKIKAKSAMKEFFQKADVKTMRYLVVKGKADKKKAEKFRDKVGYPLFVKPNVGVGAAHSYSLKNDADFDAFFEKKLPEPYIMEEYIAGIIQSFDGICDDQGEVVFATSDVFPTPVADLVNDQLDDFYYTSPFSLPMEYVDNEKFLAAGKRVVKSFGIRKRFFHIEFFVLTEDKPGLAKKGEFVALECNMRPPGGYTPDLIDYANSVSVYDIYADVIAFNATNVDLNQKKYYAATVGLRDCYKYVHTEQEVLERYHSNMMMYGRYPDHMADAMGNTYYYARFDTIEQMREFDDFCREKVK